MKISICAAKKFLCFMLCVLVLGVTGLFGGTNKVLAEIQIDTNTDVINLQNDRFALSLNKTNDLLTLTDLSNGYIWNSIVADGLQDENAEGIAKTNLMSQLIVTYKSAMMTEMATNSYSDCVMNKTVEYSVDKNTITVVYKFKKLGFSIPVRFTITDDGFTSEIDAKNIIEGENSILSISLLPYFGAANSQDLGYMVVPDGSGAVVNFNNQKSNIGSYSKHFYGGDKSVISNAMPADEKNLMLPVFGEKKNDGAFLAVIDSGATCGKLNLFVAGNINSYNNIYSTFIYRTSNVIEVKDNASTTKSVLFCAVDNTNIETYRTKYCFLNGDNANYVGMAKLMGDYLENIGVKGTAQGKPYLNLEFYGASQKPASFLGFRYTKTQKLTTLEQVTDIAGEINAYCSDLQVVLKKFSKNEITGKLKTKYSFLSSLGSKKGFKTLRNSFDKENVKFAVAYDFTSFKTAGNGYNKFKNIVLGLDLSTVKLYPYKLNTGAVDETKQPTYLIVSNKYNRAIKDINNSIKKHNLEYAYFEDAGNILYSDFSNGGSQIDVTAQNIVKALGDISKNTKTILSSPNMYALPSATVITDIPSVSSSYQIFDYDIPFYQIAVRGLLDYSGEVLNYKGYTIRELLKDIECGANLSYAITACDSKELLYTDDEELYATSYVSLKDNIKEWYQKSSEVIKAVQNSPIIDHEYKNNIAVTKYENGVKVYVNYGYDEVNIDGLNISSEDFLVVKEG